MCFRIKCKAMLQKEKTFYLSVLEHLAHHYTSSTSITCKFVPQQFYTYLQAAHGNTIKPSAV